MRQCLIVNNKNKKTRFFFLNKYFCYSLQIHILKKVVQLLYERPYQMSNVTIQTFTWSFHIVCTFSSHSLKVNCKDADETAQHATEKIWEGLHVKYKYGKNIDPFIEKKTNKKNLRTLFRIRFACRLLQILFISIIMKLF